MNNILNVPISAVTALTAERAILVMREILRSECGYARLSPAALTISDRLTVADGGVDAEVNAPGGHKVPSDCIFQVGLTGFQIKAGKTFKPWTPSAIRGELLDRKGRLHSEVARLLGRHGRYTLLCTGHDLTPEQRNDAKHQISLVLSDVDFKGYEGKLDVLGASQVADFAERYPGTASLLAVDPIQEAWVLEEWQGDAHMTNDFEASSEQLQVVTQIRNGLQARAKHIRVLGEPGLGKTRIVLEAVKDPAISPYVLYFPHGSKFGQTKLFRQLLKFRQDRPLVLVIDELPESELSDIWRHLKPRCGSLKIVTLDHGADETYDEDIDRITAPRLPDETIRQILAGRVGESHELDRWVAICEGSPRVAQAVADNLRANPGDLLKPPATVPVWSRFLHGYGSRDSSHARQVDCVARHLALFSRFGFEAPVADEAVYIAELIGKVDPTVGWAQFQEIVRRLRTRRVLQGSRTLFFVPKALHIYLWKQFWESYGPGFDFTRTFTTMPESLHSWFMNMFKYAGDAATAEVIGDVLKPDGMFSDRVVLTSAQGTNFLSILAEANPRAVLRLLEATIAKWGDQELLDFKENRQNIVWAIEKIAVWPALTVRAIQVLARFAINENSNYSNNSTGTLVGLFRIGPEAAATESTPEARLPAMLKLLRSSEDKSRRLALKAMAAALDCRGLGYRIVGPEYQGLRERAKLWVPATYEEWWHATLNYFQALVDETRAWPIHLRGEVCHALLGAVEQQIKTPTCTELAFKVLRLLIDDSAMQPEKLNRFFWYWREYEDDDKHPEIARRLRNIERGYTRRDLASRFRRYVTDVDWTEWDGELRERRIKRKNRIKTLVTALASRIARHPHELNQIQHLLAPVENCPALWYFGERLGENDQARALLSELSSITLKTKHQVCLHGYLSAMRTGEPELYRSTIKGFLDAQSTAWLGATIALRSDYDDELFLNCLDVLERRWIDPDIFAALRFGKAIESVPAERVGNLLSQLSKDDSRESAFLLIDLLNSIPFDDSSPFNSNFVFTIVSRAIPGEESRDGMRAHQWKAVCIKLTEWDRSYALPLLDALLTEMSKVYRLSYDSYVVPLANGLVKVNPVGAWEIVKVHFEQTLPKWRSDLLGWLKGGLSRFDEREPKGAIADLPIPEILSWIEVDPEPRAALMAHAVPGTLDEEDGGRLTQDLLCRYTRFDGVLSGISATFHSGGWTGLTSDYLKRKRQKLRRWLTAGFEIEITNWIEAEIEYLDRRIEREEIEEERTRFD